MAINNNNNNNSNNNNNNNSGQQDNQLTCTELHEYCCDYGLKMCLPLQHLVANSLRPKRTII